MAVYMSILSVQEVYNRVLHLSAVHSRGIASNETEEAVASSLFCARTCARIGDIIKIVHACTK